MVNKSLRYILYFIIFILFSLTEKLQGIYPFAIAFFVALCYTKQNILIIAIEYFISVIIFNFSLFGLFTALTPIVVIAAAFFIHFKAKISIRIYNCAIYLLISQIPHFIFSDYALTEIINLVITLVASQLFNYLFIVSLFALVTRGVKSKFTYEENIAFSLCVALAGFVLINLNVEFFSFFKTVLILGVLLGCYLEAKSLPILSMAFGLGGAVAVGDLTILGLAAIYGICGIVFNKKSVIYLSISLIFVEIIINFYFSVQYNFLELTSSAVGIVIYFVIPNKFKDFFIKIDNVKMGNRLIINKERQRLSKKLNEISCIFYKMENLLYEELSEKQENSYAEKLTKEIHARSCLNCSDREKCNKICNTEVILRDLVESAIKNGKASILNTPPYLTSCCKKINGIINLTNETIERLIVYTKNKENIKESKEIIAAQIGGMARLFEELNKESSKNLDFDKSLENRLEEEFLYANIITSEILVYRNNGIDSITLVLRDEDSEKECLLEIIATVTGEKMIVVDKQKTILGNITLFLKKAPLYNLIYADQAVAKESRNGDNIKAVNISHNKKMLILSDGMGSGNEASLISNTAIDIIEGFYKAGFDHKSVLNFASQLLNTRKSESFNALDIAILDTYTGLCSFIKQGGRESFILRDNLVEVIECGSLPMGILDEVVPLIDEVQLFNQDIFVMVSDGITDILGREQIIQLLEDCKLKNPSEISKLLIENSKRMIEEGEARDDDMSCAVGILTFNK